MLATHHKPVATEESLRFTLRDLVTPILRRKGTLSVTFLFVVSITLLLGPLPFQKYPSHSTILAQAAPAATEAASNTMPGMQGSQSLNEADLDREAKLEEQNYLLYLSSQEQQRADDRLANKTIPNVTTTVASSILLLPAHSSAVIAVFAILFGLLISLPVTYIADYLDPCFHSPVQVIRTLRIPLVVAIPKRTP